MANLWRAEGDRILLDLHIGQSKAWQSDKRFVFVLAGTQGGKTSFGPWWLWNQIQECGEGDYLAVTASFDLFKLKMLPELRMVLENVLDVARYWSGDKVMELRDPSTGQFWANRSDDPMWGRIILRSAQSSGGLESATAKAAWLDECGQDGFTLEDWEAVQRRLSLSQGRVLGTTTIYNLGWVKGEIYDRWRDGDTDVDVISFPSYANPAFPKAEYERMKNRLPEWRFSMFYRGEFSRPAGLIYADFTDAMLVDSFAIPEDWTRAVGVDFGGANTAILWLAENPDDNRWYLYREYLEGGKTTTEHAKSAREGLGKADNYFAAGGAPSETQERLDWNAAHFPLAEPQFSSVEAGIDRVTALIKEDRFRVFKSCRGVRDEFGTYRRKLDDAGNPTDEILDKRHFHRLDALRYIAAQIESRAWWIS